MTHPHNESPVNPLPPVVVALFLIMAGLELAFSLGARGLIGGPDAVGWRTMAIERFAFSGAVLDWMRETGRYPAEHLVRFLGYAFVHVTFMHGLFVMVILLAMGKIVAEAMGAVAFLAVFVVSTVFGALVWGLALDDPALLVGGFPAVYGLIGSFTYLLWLRLGQVGAPQMRAFTLIGLLLFIQLVFSLLFDAGSDWIADIAGFVAGFMLSIVLVPGGLARLITRIRRQ
ncbi:rhomboid family intramembrane serine protease [Cognatishimia sp. F0-27]|uniref:rhomboid family intramembrane serine protease n=1 Tax=Cognatishimia sp. F0-27 TaxID=2816855 RepID=UPI001D0C3448|nr:rhomboid family intramembrane serine protease [Cognatishimia sp. F0-27]MCC1493962.1 rhomboid family intramembrane serine protease [Cognatishimia sp. F0-27]